MSVPMKSAFLRTALLSPPTFPSKAATNPASTAPARGASQLPQPAHRAGSGQGRATRLPQAGQSRRGGSPAGTAYRKITARSAHPAAIRKHMTDYGYHISAAQYGDGARALGLDDDPGFLFVFQEKTAPYLVTVAQLDDGAIQAGREQMAAACEIWRDCTATGIWPGYSDGIETITLPPWAVVIGLPPVSTVSV